MLFKYRGTFYYIVVNGHKKVTRMPDKKFPPSEIREGEEGGWVIFKK